MTDIDRELKEVQLQRERLALKRELARSQLSEGASAIVGRGLALGARAMTGVGAVAAFTRRWWWVPIGAAALATACYAGLEWKDGYEREQLQGARASYEADRSKFVDARCAGNPSRRSCASWDAVERWNCLGARLRAQEQDTCTPAAEAAFIKLHGEAPR